jgi:hypothetical protein
MLRRAAHAGHAHEQLLDLRSAIATAPGGQLLLGRDRRTCHIVLASATCPLGLSRNHAHVSLRAVDGAVLITDLGTTNGTYVRAALHARCSHLKPY